ANCRYAPRLPTRQRNSSETAAAAGREGALPKNPDSHARPHSRGALHHCVTTPRPLAAGSPYPSPPAAPLLPGSGKCRWAQRDETPRRAHRQRLPLATGSGDVEPLVANQARFRGSSPTRSVHLEGESQRVTEGAVVVLGLGEQRVAV